MFLARFCICFSVVRNQGHSLFCLLAFLILFSSDVIVIGHAPLFKNVLASFVFVCTIFAQFVIISISLLQINLCFFYHSCCWAIFYFVLFSSFVRLCCSSYRFYFIFCHLIQNNQFANKCFSVPFDFLRFSLTLLTCMWNSLVVQL